MRGSRLPFRCSVLTSALLVTAFWGMTVSSSYAQSSDIPQAIVDQATQSSSDTKTQALPIGRVVVTEKSGQTAIMSDNGRYRISGPITDTWTQTEIRFYDDAVFSANHLPLENIGLDASVLAPLYYGQGETQNVLAFVSPDDPESRRFLSELPRLKDDFTFELVVVPSSNTPTTLATAFACVDNPDDALDALLSGQDMTGMTPQENCNLQLLNHRLIAFNLLGFYDLPAVVAPSSRVSVGPTKQGWASFLLENRE